MDRPIQAGERWRRRKRPLIAVTAGLVVVVTGVVWGAEWLRPSLRRNRVRTAQVTIGPIEAAITASGVVVPEIEHVIVSPLDTRVTRILRRPGATLARGDAIVELDANAARLDVEKLVQQLALKQNAGARTRITLDDRLASLDAQIEAKVLEHAGLRERVAANRQLRSEGLISAESLRESELSEAQAGIELKQLRAQRVNAQRATAAELEQVALEMTTLRNEIAEARRQLELAAPRADRDGVLTWVVAEEGGSVRRGDPLGRVADLGSFRVDATVSDVHTRRVAGGLPVEVKVNDDTLTGRIAGVSPTIQNGLVTLRVALDEPSSPALRSNLRVDVAIVTGRKARALRIRKGPFSTGEAAQEVFVIRGDRAVRTPVRLGLSGFEEYEVVEGLSPGDEVVISDMRDYAHLRELRLR